MRITLLIGSIGFLVTNILWMINLLMLQAGFDVTTNPGFYLTCRLVLTVLTNLFGIVLAVGLVLFARSLPKTER